MLRLCSTVRRGGSVRIDDPFLPACTASFSGASIPLGWGIQGESLDELIACASGILEPDEEGVRDSGILIRACFGNYGQCANVG